MCISCHYPTEYIIFCALLCPAMAAVDQLVTLLEIYLAEESESFEDDTDEDNGNGGGGGCRYNELTGDSAEVGTIESRDAGEDQVYTVRIK